MKRSATDLVVIILTTMVALTVLFSVVGIIILRITHPEVDVKSGTEFLGSITTTIVGALVGFIGGRATGRAEANGQHA